MIGRSLAVLLGLGLLATAAAASETITYTYDALGRLVTVSRAGSVNAGYTEGYSYDPAGNRTNVNVATGPCGAVTFTVASNGAVTEGTNSVFTVTKTGTTASSCSVNYATAGGTATSGSDFTAKSGTLTFTSAQTSQTVSVTTIDDATAESAETFSLALSVPTGGAVIGTPGSATATINDNDSGPCSAVSFAVSDASVTEGAPLNFIVTKTGSTTGTCSVNYATANGNAVAPTHYTAKSGTLSFTSAQTQLTVSVTTIDNSRLNATLTMYLNLSSPTGGSTISDSQGVGSIGPSGGCKTCLQSVDPGTSVDSSTTTDSTDPPPDAPQ